MTRILIGLLVGLSAASAGEPALPPGAVARLGETRYRHAEGSAAALSPDGRRVALSTPGSVTVYDLTTGRPAYRLAGREQVQQRKVVEGESPPRAAAAFTLDGKHLLTADGSGPIRVWDAASGKAVRVVSPPEQNPVAGDKQYERKVTDLLQCPGGKKLLARSDGHFVFTLDPADWSLTYRGRDWYDLMATDGDGGRWAGHYAVEALYQEFSVSGADFTGEVPNGVSCVALSADGRLAAGGGEVVRLWDLKTKDEIKLTDAKWPRGWARCVAITPDGKTLLAAGDDVPAVARWNTVTGKRLADLPANRGGVGAMALSGDGKVLVTTGSDHLIRRFDLTTGKQIADADGFAGRVTVALSPDGKQAAGGDRAGVIRVWADPFTGAAKTLREGGSDVDEMIFSADGKRLFAAHGDRSVAVWDVSSGKEVALLRPPSGIKGRWYHPVTRLAVAPDGRRVVCSVDQAAVWAWDVGTGKVIWERRADGEGKGVTACRPVFTPDGAEVLVGVDQGQVVRLDSASGRELGRFGVPPPNRGDVDHLAVSPDGRSIVAHAYHSEGRLDLLDPDSGRAYWGADFPRERFVRTVAFAPSGAWLLTTHADGRACVWGAATGKVAFELATTSRDLSTIQVSADGRRAVTDGPGATALVWSLAPPAGDGPAPGALWDWLGGDDAGKAYRAVWLLAGRLDAEADEIRKRLPPMRDPDPAKKLPGLIADLDSPKFAVREAASRELGELVARFPTLRRDLRTAAGKTGSAEVKGRLTRILQAVPEAPSAADLRRIRVLAAVELAGNSTARKLLAEWADGTPHSPLTEGARLALDRLKRR